jgi:hypothetical protein
MTLSHEQLALCLSVVVVLGWILSVIVLVTEERK